MKPGQGKAKGSSFERNIGYKISLWISNGQRKDLLCRTVGSGAQFTSAAGRGYTAGIPGDLRAQDPLAYAFCSQYVLECKHWRDLQIIRFLNGEGDLYTAMQKVQHEAIKERKLWMLIAKQNNRPEILLMPYWKTLLLPFHTLFNGTVSLYTLDDFLKAVSPKELIPEGVKL